MLLFSVLYIQYFPKKVKKNKSYFIFCNHLMEMMQTLTQAWNWRGCLNNGTVCADRKNNTHKMS